MQKTKRREYEKIREEKEMEHGMKIVAGLGSVDEYIRFCEAGADEFFAGYVPYEWNRKYGTVLPLNRREVFCSNVQLGSFSELEILSAMVRKYGKPVHLTFNALYYIPEQYPEIAELIQRCRSLGFFSFILADPALLCYLEQQNIHCEIHLSGELGEANSRMLSVFQKQSVQRLIFHRKNRFSDMEAIVKSGRQDGIVTEYEAFVLNELCQFSGAFCNSLHCDEMGYLCRVPYRLGTIKQREEAECAGGDTAQAGSDRAQAESDTVCAAQDSERQRKWNVLEKQEDSESDAAEELPYEEDGYLCGATGCGLCALYQLGKAGITHVKLVGRGNYVDFMERDIRHLKRALALLAESGSEADYKKRMKRELFPKGCSGNCYYRELPAGAAERSRPRL